MGEEVDIVFEQGTERDERLEIINTQLQVLANVADLEEGLYDDLQADKIRVVSDALKLINKIQKQLIKEI